MLTHSVQFQSTHPRGVRPQLAAKMRQLEIVSIHAPAWGATSTAMPPNAARTCFNPRTRVGCDHHRDGRKAAPERVSIHAPAWGATLLEVVRRGAAVVSIHAPAWGATLGQHLTGQPLPVSIHAPAWGATSCGHGPMPRPCGFNPRTRVGCDLETGIREIINNQFQSTHPRGVRHSSGAK